MTCISHNKEFKLGLYKKHMLQYLTFPNNISVVYGPPASGKTTLCLQIVANNPGKVIFIDTENTFNVERLQNMNPLVDLENVILIKATRYKEQFAAVKSLENMKHVSLVVIDSFTKYYRKKLQEKITIRPVTIRMLKMLKDLHVPVLLTSQVYTTPAGETKPIGGDLFRRYVPYTLELYNDQARKLVIKETKVYIPFIITDRGLTP